MNDHPSSRYDGVDDKPVRIKYPKKERIGGPR